LAATRCTAGRPSRPCPCCDWPLARFARLLAASPAPASGCHVRRPGFLAHARQLGPGGVEVALGPLGAGTQFAACFPEHPGAGLHRIAQFVALPADLRPVISIDRNLQEYFATASRPTFTRGAGRPSPPSR